MSDKPMLTGDQKRGLVKGGTTALGAVAGLLASRALIPEKRRNMLNQGAGALLGGTVGYTTGDHLSKGMRSEQERDKYYLDHQGDVGPDQIQYMKDQGVEGLVMPGYKDYTGKANSPERYKQEKMQDLRFKHLWEQQVLKAAQNSNAGADRINASKKRLAELASTDEGVISSIGPYLLHKLLKSEPSE